MLLDVSYDYPDCVAVPAFSIYEAGHSELCESLLYPRNQRYIETKKEKKGKSRNGRGWGKNAVKAPVFNFRRKKENLEAAG